MLGPHFYFDLVRLPRKGWSTFFRCLYIVLLLVGLSITYQARQQSADTPAAYARIAHGFAVTLILLQDILILTFLPVYVSSAIAEERENQTLEALFLCPLTDKQIVLGKFGGRLLHLSAVILAGVPVLFFMNVWGNVGIDMLLYHLANTILIATTASSICILMSAQSPVVFQAVTSSYPLIFVLGLVGESLVFGLPWVLSGNDGRPRYVVSLLVLAVAHVYLARVFLVAAMTQLNELRKLQSKPLRKKSAAFTLSERPARPVPTMKGRLLGSHIHPLALPISENALFWKECLKDGSYWSLTWRWLIPFVVAIGTAGVLCRLMLWGLPTQQSAQALRGLVGSFAYTAYFVAVPTFALVVVFQTTLCVAGEREQNTLEFLLLSPHTRAEILRVKWLGPLWRNWPILAVGIFGIFLGFLCDVYGAGVALGMFLFPLPFLLLCSFLALSLSTIFRRVLLANIVMVGLLLLVLIGHIFALSAGGDLGIAYVYVLFGTTPSGTYEFKLATGMRLVLAEQGIYVLLAGCLAFFAWFTFGRKDYQGKI